MRTGTRRLADTLLAYVPPLARAVVARARLFFVVGMGRSGTVFLANLLAQAPRTAVFHETESDFEALVDAFWSPARAAAYLAGPRGRLVAARIWESRCETYGEVNSLLRHHVDALRARWNPVLLHVVRDGRLVVRSIMNRTAFTDADHRHTGRLSPPPGSAWAAEWPAMDRFARVCWYWAHANEYLAERALPLVRLEDVTGSYERFVEQVARPLGLDLSPALWQAEAARPRNPSTETAFPGWEGWTAEQRRRFETICGPVMARLGYRS